MKLKTPSETAAAALEAGHAKGALTTPKSLARLIALAIVAGAYIAFGGTLSLIAGQGMPGLSADNPAIGKMAGALMFPIGLILIVTLGGELFTGNNALLIPPLMKRRLSPWRVAANWAIVWVANFVGALLFATLMVWGAGLTQADPWHSAIMAMAETKCSLPWATVFIRAIGANWCVCLAIWLALSGHSLLEKMAGCFLPVMAFVALGYEHCVANMFFIPLGMMEGAAVSIPDLFIANLIPATLGNILGGALFVGALFTRLHLKQQS
ncbi:MAG: formate/nitrite transporter family protein [Pseudoflavonifractor sp.]|nr:formate/nitrite transporter family protein [Alloprevotella sp.]MCM1116956.1 formate/nitrite transporter family protein [Pseudoflavonifractor sp.]